ncbi:hypothetical protein KI387_013092 [Taxus chinensis]|uniref:Rab-GAP TBC domain-containing protein n=1 Tax=Taxus chinensis TaxID=29808 RepID=A0AA38FD13_TAXCH|nr:hypothetical protein KI387_013092 [Taxus chinensis]
MMEEGQKTAHLNMDNPLSQDPESVWGRFFRNAELERSIDKDLSRLYPEHGSYFQTPACQAMLRRILLVWSLRHPEYSYRQGMHELLAPLLYVLHVDVTHLSHVKHLFENLSDERFDGLPLQENNSSPRGNFEKQIKMSPVVKKSDNVEEDRRLSDHGGVEILKCQANRMRISSIDELDPEVRAIFSGSDAYGAEGELGALLSGRFIEHDAYCMFDTLLSGQGGPVAMADYFMNYPEVGSASGLSPVIEASARLYNLLSVIDISLYSHLVELHVEPQFFALRWLRVLFGREFVLHELLLVWDAIFSAANSYSPLANHNNHLNYIASCDRSAFISAMAVSMLLHLRPSLLATPDATTCLKRLLNFPRNTDVRKLIENAVSLQSLAMNSVCTTPSLTKTGWNSDYTRMGKLTRSTSVSPTCQIPAISHSSVVKNQKSSPCSPDRLRVMLPESYWEEKWITSILQKVMPESSSSNEVQDGNIKDSVGHGGEIISIDSSNPCHIVLDSNDQTEQQISREENCGTSLKHDLEVVSNRAHDYRNGTFGKATRHRLLDDQVKVDTQIEFDVDKLLMSTTNEQLAPDQLLSCLQGIVVTESGEKKSSECAINNVNKIRIGVQEELPNQSKGEGNGLCQSNHCEKSHAASKELSGKLTTGNASQMGGIWTFWRKQKLSAAAHTGRPRWMWNFGRNISGVKINKEPSKDEFSENRNDSSRSYKVPQEDNINWVATTNDNVPDEEFTKTNFDSDCRKSEGKDPFPSEEGIDVCSKDESTTLNADLAGEKELSKEYAHLGKETNHKILENRFSANYKFPVCDGTQSSQEKNATSDIAVSSTPCFELVLEDGDGTTYNADVKGTKVLNSSVIEASQSPAGMRTASICNNPSINLRIMGHTMLQKIQVLESSFLQDSMLKKDGAEVNALTELREIGNKLLQM